MSRRGRLGALGLLLGLSAALSACRAPAIAPPASPAPTPTDPPVTRLYPLPRLNSPEYGIQAFLWWHVEDYMGERDADLVKDLGFGWLKHALGWRDISNVRGDYYWGRTDKIVAIARTRGLKVLFRLDHQPQWAQADPTAELVSNSPPADFADFGDFCGALAAHYRGQVAAYEVWNEPNLAGDWGGQPPDPAEYVALLKVCYLAIKAADPQAIVISAGLAPTAYDDPTISMPDDKFYAGFYAAGGAAYADMLGVHAPGYMFAPETDPTVPDTDPAYADPNLSMRWLTFRHVEDIRAIMVQAGDADKQIAVTEMGWTSDPRADSPYHWHAVTEEQKADYLVRAYQYARTHWQPWIGLMSAIYISNQAWTDNDEQYWWAVTRPSPPDGPPGLLPAYLALQAMEK